MMSFKICSFAKRVELFNPKNIEHTFYCFHTLKGRWNEIFRFSAPIYRMSFRLQSFVVSAFFDIFVLF